FPRNEISACWGTSVANQSLPTRESQHLAARGQARLGRALPDGHRGAGGEPRAHLVARAGARDERARSGGSRGSARRRRGRGLPRPASEAPAPGAPHASPSEGNASAGARGRAWFRSPSNRIMPDVVVATEDAVGVLGWTLRLDVPILFLHPLLPLSPSLLAVAL